MNGSFKRRLWESVLFAVIWSLWYEQNQVKFNNAEYSMSLLTPRIQRRVAEWIIAFMPKFPYSSSQVISNIEAVWNWDSKAKW